MSTVETNMDKIPQGSQVITINGKDYNFEFCRKGIVYLLDNDIDFDKIKVDVDNGNAKLMKHLPELTKAALIKNHRDITITECEDIADELFAQYSLNSLFLMFVGLYGAVFSQGGQIPLAQKIQKQLEEATAEIHRLQMEVEKESKKLKK